MLPRDVGLVGNYDRILLAAITDVDTKKGTCSIAFFDQVGFRDHVPLPVVGMSRNAWIRYMPQVNDVVMVGLRGNDQAVILGWYPYNYDHRTDHFTKEERNAAGGEDPEMGQEIAPGEIDARSAGGAYLRLNNIGDILLMGAQGRLQINGLEGSLEQVFKATKWESGQSVMRFGSPYRPFPLINHRELPTGAVGQPVAGPAPYQERRTEIRDSAGNLLVSESVGTAFDEDGIAELSGSNTPAGKTVKKVLASTAGAVATQFVPAQASDGLMSLANAALGAPISALPDRMYSKAKEMVEGVITNITSQITSIAESVEDLAGAVSDMDIIGAVDAVSGLVSGAGSLADGSGMLTSHGTAGKSLRYRLQIHKGADVLAGLDIDEDGGIVLMSDDADGITINAEHGKITLTADKAVKLFSELINIIAKNIVQTATKSILMTAGNDVSRIAGKNIKDQAEKITRAASTSITDGAPTIKITAMAGGAEVSTITLDGSKIRLYGPKIEIEATGDTSVKGSTVHVESSGICTISGSQVNIN